MPSALWSLHLSIKVHQGHYDYIVINSKIEENTLTNMTMPKYGKCAPRYSPIADATAINGFTSWAPLRRTSNSESGVIRGAAAEGGCREYPAYTSRARTWMHIRGSRKIYA